MLHDTTAPTRRMTPLVRVATLLLTLFCAGCFEHEQVLTVRADGSGTLRETSVVKGPMLAMTRSMDAQEQPGNESGGATGASPGEQEARDHAADLGEGVRFVSFESFSKGDREGATAVYAFDDVTHLHLTVGTPDKEHDPEPGQGARAGQAQGEDDQWIDFQFQRDGDKRVLVATFKPKGGKSGQSATAGDPAHPAEPAAAGESTAAMDETAQGVLQAILPMFAGARLRTVVEVEGKLLESDAPIENESQVVLMDLDFDRILADKAAAAKFGALGNHASLDEVRTALAGTPGVVIPPTDEVRIVFE